MFQLVGPLADARGGLDERDEEEPHAAAESTTASTAALDHHLYRVGLPKPSPRREPSQSTIVRKRRTSRRRGLARRGVRQVVTAPSPQVTGTTERARSAR